MNKDENFNQQKYTNSKKQLKSLLKGQIIKTFFLAKINIKNDTFITNKEKHTSEETKSFNKERSYKTLKEIIEYFCNTISIGADYITQDQFDSLQ